MYGNNGVGVSLSAICAPAYAGAVGLFAHLDFNHPFGDKRFTHIFRALFIHVVIDQFQLFEFERQR